MKSFFKFDWNFLLLKASLTTTDITRTVAPSLRPRRSGTTTPAQTGTALSVKNNVSVV